MASGTAALALTLIAAGIGPGDEVLVPGHTFIASALGVLHAGRDAGLLRRAAGHRADRPGSAAAALVGAAHGGDRRRAPVRTGVRHEGRINTLAERHGLFVLEDAAQAHGATCDGRRAGSLGDAAAFSFYPSKNLGALGDGGAVCTATLELAARVRELRHLGQRGKGEHVGGRLQRAAGRPAGGAAAGQAAPPRGLERGASRPRSASARRAPGRARPPRRAPRDALRLPPLPGAPRGARPAGRAAARRGDPGGSALHAGGAPPCRLRRICPRAPARVELPESEAWAAEELSLPMFAELSDAEVDRIAAACRTACASFGSRL